MNINKKLLAGYGVIIILLVVLTGYFTFSQLEQLNSLNSRIIDNISNAQGQISLLETTLFQVHSAVFLFQAKFSSSTLEQLLESIQKVYIQLEGIRTAYAESEMQSILRPVEKQLLSRIESLQELQKLPLPAEVKSSKLFNDFTPQSLLAEINSENLLAAIQKYLRGQMLQDKLMGIEIQKNAYMYLGLIFLIAVIVGLSIGISLSRSITATIRHSSDQLNLVSDEVLETSEEESNMSLTQSGEINQASETLKSLTDSANQIAANTAEVTRLVRSAADQMIHLKDMTQKIEKITSVIEEISQQINILSLNASIEAFRAGDQGKGFSAVAMEIRKLAENTRRSTEGIAALVQSIQDSAKINVDSIEKAVAQVNQIAELIDHQNSATIEISEAVSRVNLGMQSSVENIKKTKSAAEALHNVATELRVLI